MIILDPKRFSELNEISDPTDDDIIVGLRGSENVIFRVGDLPGGGGEGAVDSVNGQTGDVELDTGDIPEVTDKKYVTDAEKTKLSNTSGVNTGDQDLSGLVPKTTTVNGKALTTNISLDKSDVGLGNVDNTSDVNKPVSTAQQAALDLKQSLSQKDTAGGYAGLDGTGKINPSQLPAVAVTNTFVVNSQAAMLALDAQEGDVAVRTDLNKTFILTATPATTLGNWQELLTPTDQVSSVFGRTGPVTAQNGDYTASQITNTPAGNVAATTVQAAIDELDSEKVPTSRTVNGKALSTNITVEDGDVPVALSGNAGIDYSIAIVQAIASAGGAGAVVGDMNNVQEFLYGIIFAYGYVGNQTQTVGKGYVNHGSVASTARPSGYASIEWVGSVEPTNAIDGDTWVDTSA